MRYLLIIPILFISGNDLFAKVKIKDISLNENKVVVSFSGTLKERPSWFVKGSTLKMTIPSSVVWPKIKKKAKWEKKGDTRLSVYQHDKKSVALKAEFPFKLDEKGIRMLSNKNTIVLKIPNNWKKNDVSFLERLLAEDIEKEKKSNPIIPLNQKDEVSLEISGSEKKSSPEKMQMGWYLIKFAGFLLLVLGLFLGLVHLFKRKVMGKGKLGFLNKTSLISIMGNSPIGHKKNLLVVKVHEQVFLLATSERGVHYLSELDHTNSLLKQREKEVSGKNFDSTMEKQGKKQKKFKLKEELRELNSNGQVEDEVKLSDQIKKKIKQMRPLQ